MELERRHVKDPWITPFIHRDTRVRAGRNYPNGHVPGAKLLILRTRYNSKLNWLNWEVAPNSFPHPQSPRGDSSSYQGKVEPCPIFIFLRSLPLKESDANSTRFCKNTLGCGVSWVPEAQVWTEQDPQPSPSPELPEALLKSNTAGAYPRPGACECLAMGFGDL